MAIKNDSYKLYEPRIKKILSQSKISKLEIVELFEIMHIYNAVPKLIPEELSKWCNNMGIELRDKSRSLDRTLGLTKDVRLTDNLAMSMVVSDIWAEIFNEENQKIIERAFSIHDSSLEAHLVASRLVYEYEKTIFI